MTLACEVRELTELEVMQFYCTTTHHEGIIVDGKIVAVGGLAPIEKRMWGFLDTREGAGKHALTMIRYMRHRLNKLAKNTVVYVPCDTDNFHNPNAERLLRLIGFLPLDELYLGMRVWAWRCLQH